MYKKGIYVQLSKEEFAKALVFHQMISQRCEYAGDADAVLSEFGISDHMIDGLT